MEFFQKTIEAIKRRRWEVLRSNWLLHLPNLVVPGAPPEATVSEVLSLTNIPQNLITEAKEEANRHRLCIAHDNVAGLREAVFWESLFLLHKARHVLGSTEFQVRDGLRTWALANGYQGAFFAAKAILGFLGISCPEIQNKVIIIDLFPAPVVRPDDYSEAAFYYIGARLDHRPIWELFQRILAISVIEIWPRDVVNKLKSVESKNFAKQRNDIHYKNHGWLLADLHDFELSDGFGALRHWGVNNKDIDFERADISVVLCIAITKLAYSLLRDLEQRSKKLSSELDILQSCVERDRHPLYANDLLT